jgi:hypothetical protein
MLKTPILSGLVLLMLGTGTAAPIITEFMAANTITLQDEDGAYSDWIELFNPGPDVVELADYGLSDRANQVTWVFPTGVVIAANEYLLVFASGKNKRIAGQELHTNFKLSAAGESLVLFAPDGQTIVSSFIDYPGQQNDISFGSESVETWIETGDPARFHVPNDGSLGTRWVGTNFPDISWQNVQLGIGYDTGVTSALDGVRSSTDFAHTFDPGDILPGPGNSDFSIRFDDAVELGNGTAFALLGNTLTYETHENAGGLLLDGDHWLSNVSSSWTFEVALSVDGSPGHVPGSAAHGATFILGGGGNRETLSIQSAGSSLGLNDTTTALEANGSTDNSSAAGAQTYRIAYDSVANRYSIWKNGVILRDRMTAVDTFTFNFCGIGDAFSTTTSGSVAIHYIRYDFTGAFEPDTGGGIYGGSMRTNVEAAMSGQNAGAYVRIPFTVSDAGTAYPSMHLAMKYDDGFIAYLNGNEIARRNAPAASDWQSTSVSNRLDTAGLTNEVIVLDAVLPAIQAGANLLSLHGLNHAASAERFLMAPQLSAIMDAPTLHFYDQPTPGEANMTGFLGFIADTQFSLNRGFYDAPIQVAVTSATPDAIVHYTTDGSLPSETHGSIANGPINIATTTSLRAMAFKPSYRPTNVDTHTYLFVNDVLGQDGTGRSSPTNPGISDWDYEMDPNVVNDPRFQGQMTNSLRALPSLSVSLPEADLWGPNGIYANPTMLGEAWERAAAMEVLYPDDPGANEQARAGIRIQGAGSRFRDKGKKSMRLAFRGKYGDSKLKMPFFGDDGPNNFDTIVLRGNYFDSWTVHTTSATQDIGRNTALMFRTHLGTITHRDMGHHAVRSNWMHLYLNGQYWGVYNTHERPDAEFAQLYLGGDDLEYDVLKQRPRGQPNGSPPELTEGDLVAWNQLMALMSEDSTDPLVYEQILSTIERDAFIDYILLNLFGGNRDWPHNNWYAIRHRPTNGPFMFYSWDPENFIFENNENRTGVNTDNSPGVIYDRLRQNTEFQIAFADRVQYHLFNEGALSVSNNIARFQAVADELELALHAEAARWGDTRQEPPHTVADDWLPMIGEKVNNYFPQRNATLISQLRAVNLYPVLEAPAFSKSGGSVPTGFALELSNPNPGGQIYIMLNGDPRAAGGGINAGASLYTGPMVLPYSSHVHARIMDNGDWSALTGSSFIVGTPAAGHLVLSELHYHPADPTLEEDPTDQYVDDDFEFLELYNTHTNTIELSGLHFTSGIDFDFELHSSFSNLQAGARIILVVNRVAFSARYPLVNKNGIAGVFQNNTRLGNLQETLALTDASGSNVFTVPYLDDLPWPAEADGAGPSLVLMLPESLPDHTDPANWRSSAILHGRPLERDSWRYVNWASARGFVGPDAAPGADGDLDGIPNSLAYALRLETYLPGAGEPVQPFPRFETTWIESLRYPQVTWRQNGEADDLMWHFEASFDLEIWMPLSPTLVERPGDGSIQLRAQAPEPLTGTRFFRGRLLVP